MRIHRIQTWIGLAILAWAVAVFPAFGQAVNDGRDFTDEQKADFLMKAKVIKSTHTAKGITAPYRLTLSDGTVTHDGDFQIIHEDKPQMKFQDGAIEFNFKDYWEFNIAGYQVAKLLGMENMIPVTVERTWNGERGSLSWWIPDVAMDEADRSQKHVPAPDPEAWNKQMYKIRVFDELVYDVDANLTNVLITKDWKIWRIDFSRAFRSWKKLRKPEDLVMCDKSLLEKLKALNEDEVKNATKKYLSGTQVKALMARRDLIVTQFNTLVAEKGEPAVIY